ncbi:Eco57I restriction-modification methylase domain-containing protein [Sporosarcina sp. P33]|uniref:Eco57I restriction-modification methylase domain-containing protein n=1 Tax=Sporosarcina sp. P33 TaxID=1930764 RepID=UPI0009C0B2E4|nr:Eco57I restriction-modification methylase domain-containing protein [Sporosarcina sp. P33]ARD47512.1 hypothetical protein SporoP33_04180 [Sporosarcina sp. P33]
MINDNFFNFDTEVDCIIMNPPYIRHENLHENSPDFLNKNNVIDSVKEIGVNLSVRSNLYLYFFLKACSLISKEGNIIAIMPDTWIKAQYGRNFKKYILNNFSIKSILTFENDVFPDAVVESCIIHLQKSSKEEISSNIVKFLELNESNKEIKKEKTVEISKVRSFEQIYLDELTQWNLNDQDELIWIKENLVDLDTIVNINRGIGTNANKLFIDNLHEMSVKYPKYFKEIICTPKNIKGYSTSNIDTEQYILDVNEPEDELPEELERYLIAVNKEILETKKPKTLYDKVTRKNKKWYYLNLDKPADIIFSYIIRERKNFILNEQKKIARDNFYKLNISGNYNEHLILAILNSDITSYFIESIGREHGKGLLKIQKYELDKLLIVNPSKISSKDQIKLIRLGKELTKNDDRSIISEINEIILPYVSGNLNIDKLSLLLMDKVNKRIKKKA